MAGLSGGVLPVHPQPKEDEIFSSWLCRIAQANGIKLHTLEVQIWERGKQIWTRDIDRSIDDSTLLSVAEICGTSIERATETCLRSFEGRLFEQLLVSGNSDWVLPAGVYHRTRTRPFMQFCPSCLKSDSTCYFRKHWRLAITTFCRDHNVMLHDRCPCCQSTIMFFRQELGNRNSVYFDSLRKCSACGFDLAETPTAPVHVLDKKALATLRLQLDNLDLGWGFNDKLMFQYSHLYFRVLRNLLQKFTSSWTPRRLLRVAEIRLGFKSNHPAGRVPFEYLDLQTRHELLQAATWLLLDWPDRFTHIFEANRCRYSEFTREFEQIPFWFLREIQHLGKNPVGPSSDEIGAMKIAYEKASEHGHRKKLRRAIASRIPGASLEKFFASGI